RLELAGRRANTALLAPHDLAIPLHAPGGDPDARRHGLPEAPGDALLPAEEHRHVDVLEEDAHVLPVAGELGGGGDPEPRCLSLVLRAERAVADQAEPRLRTHGADSGEDSQQVVMVL